MFCPKKGVRYYVITDSGSWYLYIPEFILIRWTIYADDVENFSFCWRSFDEYNSSKFLFLMQQMGMPKFRVYLG